MTQRLVVMLGALLLATRVLAAPTLIVVMGAPGEEEYARQFKKWSEQWAEAAQKAKATLHTIGTQDKKSSDKKSPDKTVPDTNSYKKDLLRKGLIRNSSFWRPSYGTSELNILTISS